MMYCGIILYSNHNCFINITNSESWPTAINLQTNVDPIVYNQRQEYYCVS